MSATSPARTARPAGRPVPRPVRSGARPTGVRRPRLAVVPERIARRSRVPFLGLVALLLLLGVSGLLLFNTWMQQSAFTVTRLQDRANLLEARQQSLAMSLERDSDPQQLAVRARRLGLVPSVHPAFVRTTDGKVLGDPTPATGEDSMRINPRAAVKPKVLAPAPRVVQVPAPTAAQARKQAQTQQQTQSQTQSQTRGQTRTSRQQSQVQQNVQQNGAGG